MSSLRKCHVALLILEVKGNSSSRMKYYETYMSGLLFYFDKENIYWTSNKMESIMLTKCNDVYVTKEGQNSQPRLRESMLIISDMSSKPILVFRGLCARK